MSRSRGVQGVVVVGADMGRRLVAELVGTFILVMFGAGSVAAALRMGDGELGFPGVVGVALAFAIAIAVAVYAFGPVSGAHINPSVTFALAVVRRFPWMEVFPYMAAQLVGGTVAAFLIVAAFPDAVDVAGVGQTVLEEGVGYAEGIAAEAIATFILLTAVMTMAVDERAPAGWSGLVIGLSVGCAVLVFLPLTGASLNAARTFGPYLAAEVGGGDVPWSEFGVYVAGPFLGGAAAAALYEFVVRPPRADTPDQVPAAAERDDADAAGKVDPDKADPENHG